MSGGAQVTIFGLPTFDVSGDIVQPIEGMVGTVVGETEKGFSTDAAAVTGVAKDAGKLAGGIAKGAGSWWETFFDFATLNFADIGLIVVGVIMALGALLISQKQTIVKVGDAAAKTGALLA